MTKTATDVKTEFEHWFRELGVEQIVGAAFHLAPPPASLLKQADDGNEIIGVHPARLTAGALSDLFGLTNWAAAGLETVTHAPVVVDTWFSTPAHDVAPFLGETPESVAKVAAAEGKAGMSLERYLVFAARYKRINGTYPDVNYWTWLLDSHERDLVLFAGFDSHGNLQINSCTPDYKDDNTGCRLVTLAAR